MATPVLELRAHSLELLPRLLPPPPQEHPDADRPFEHPFGFDVPAPGDETAGHLDEGSLTLALRSTQAGELASLEGRGLEDLLPVACAKSQDEQTGLHARAEEDIDDGKTKGHRVHRLDPQAVFVTDLFRFALHVTQSDGAQPHAVHHQPEKGGYGGARGLHVDRGEDATQHE